MELRDGKCRGLADIWTDVSGTLLDGEQDNTANHRDLDSGQNTKSHCTYKRIGIREVLLESVDGQKCEVGFLFSIAKEVYVDQLPDFKVVGGDILDNLREELRDIATFRNQLRYRKPSEDETEDEGEVTYTDKPLHCLQLLPIAI